MDALLARFVAAFQRGIEGEVAAMRAGSIFIGHVETCGEDEIIGAMVRKDIRVMVDLTGVAAARELRKRVEVSAPAGVTHLRVTPEEVQVIFPPDR